MQHLKPKKIMKLNLLLFF